MTICNPWRPGACLLVLREQVNTKAPNRSKASDGTIGDTAHQAEACSSQHNSCCVKYNGVWIIRAIDITHDPAHGCDVGVFFDRIRASRDPRVRYLIFNRRICYPTSRNGYPAWAWQPYSGDDPHTNHGHLSTFDDAARFDNTQAWAIGGTTPAGVQPAAAVRQEDEMLVRDPHGGIYKGTNRGKVGLTWDEYVSAGQPPFIQAGSDARVDELLPAPFDPAELAKTIAAAVVAAADNSATEGEAEAVASAVLAKLVEKLGGAA